jgi:hypothetical protein
VGPAEGAVPAATVIRGALIIPAEVGPAEGAVPAATVIQGALIIPAEVGAAIPAHRIPAVVDAAIPANRIPAAAIPAEDGVIPEGDAAIRETGGTTIAAGDAAILAEAGITIVAIPDTRTGAAAIIPGASTRAGATTTAAASGPGHISVLELGFHSGMGTIRATDADITMAWAIGNLLRAIRT